MVENKKIPIKEVRKTMLVDEAEQQWGLLPLMMQKPGETDHIQIGPVTRVDIGTDRPIDLDQIIDLVDENGLIVQRTVREIMDDLADEDALAKAAKECLL